MSLGLNKTKHRILSVKSTQKITKAMEMVATVKLKKFKDAMDQNSYFASEIEKQMADLFAHDGGFCVLFSDLFDSGLRICHAQANACISDGDSCNLFGFLCRS